MIVREQKGHRFCCMQWLGEVCDLRRALIVTTKQLNPTTRLMRRQRWQSARLRGLAAAKKGCLAFLGPGLITGASDDDPSGIATYSQAGAQLGFALLWLMLFTIPLMAAFQEICARIGRVTGRGLAR